MRPTDGIVNWYHDKTTRAGRVLLTTPSIVAIVGAMNNDQVEALRADFERITRREGRSVQRSRRGTYSHPPTARDWKWFQMGAMSQEVRNEPPQITDGGAALRLAVSLGMIVDASKATGTIVSIPRLGIVAWEEVQSPSEEEAQAATRRAIMRAAELRKTK